MEHKETQTNKQDLEAVLINSRFQFAIESLQIISKIKPKESFFFSPLSIYEILCMIYLGSTEITDDYLRRKTLYLSDVSKADLSQYYSQHRCSDFISRDETRSYIDDTKCWITNSKMLKDAVQHLFKSKMEIVNFHKQFSNGDLLDRIGTEIRRSLSYSFKKIKLNNITADMEIILMTMLDFSVTSLTLIGHKNIMSSSRKKQRSLTSPKMGMLLNEFCYNDNLSTYFLFPATVSEANEVKLNENIPLLVKRLASKIGMDELRKILHSDESDLDERIIRLDNFTIENNFPMVDLLRFFNVEELVTDEPNLHEFVVEGEQPLHLGGAYHRSCISLQKYTTIASAATIFFTKYEASFDPLVDKTYNSVKHSFILLIYDRKYCKILFTGVIRRNLQFDENDEIYGNMNEI